MPTYDFVCDTCGTEREVVQSIKEEGGPSCCNQMMRRKISGGGGFILKGTGWAGQDIKRGGEDGRISLASKKARELKESGEAKMEDTITVKDTEKKVI